MAEVCNIQARAVVLLTFLVTLPWTALAQLSSTYYDSSCPNVQSIVLSALLSQMQSDPRVGASITRLHFHDCFVQGCDGSVLLDDTPTFTGEKTAGPNINSLRGFSAVDAIKAAVENSCPGVVSCADILALVAMNAVNVAGGPSWTVQFGRLDSTTASFALATSNLPSPNSDVPTLTGNFANVGLDTTDLVALSGAHTFGETQCGTIDPRLYNWQNTGASDPSLQSGYLSTLQGECPIGGPTTTTVFIDQSTGTRFDNNYYTNLLSNSGTFHSDQALESDNSTSSTVNSFSGNQNLFFAQFVSSILKMGSIPGSGGGQSEVRTNCRKVN